MRDAGKGGLKSFLALVFLAGIAFCAVKIVPAYLDNYELQTFLKDVAVQATVQSPPMTVEAVQNEILAKAVSIGIPVERRDIKVTLSHSVRINLDYLVYVELPFYTLTLHFTPSAENRKIT